MNILERKVEHQIHFWSLLGPATILLAICVLLFKVSSHWYFPLSAFVGIPLCLKWKMKGMAVALTFLLTLFIASYSNLALEERYWHVGMGMAMAFSFVILALSLEEVETIVEKLQTESQSRLDNFLRLDEKMKTLEQDWGQERASLAGQVEGLTKDLSQLQEDKQALHKLVQLAKDELIGLRGQHELLLQDLFYKKQQMTHLRERIEENEVAIQELVNSDVEKQMQQLNQQLGESENKIEQLSVQYTLAQNELEQLKEENQKLESSSLAIQEQQERDRQKIVDCERQQQAQLSQLRIKEEQIEHLHQEKEAALAHLRQLQESYNQISQAEKRHQEEAARHAEQVQQLAERLTHREQEKDQLQHLLAQKEQALSQQKLQFSSELKQVIEQLKLTQSQHIQELKEEEERAKKELLHMVQEKETLNAQLAQRTKELEAAAHQMDRLQQRDAKLEETLSHTDQAKEEALKKLSELQNSYHLLETECNSLREELVAKAEEVEKASLKAPIVKLPYAPGNNRRIEGMYLQLKEQFIEKSDILDATRRELFLVQEDLLSVQKEREEQQFDLSESELLLQKEIARLAHELEKTQKEQQQEVDQLHQLIDTLFKQKSLII